MHLLPFLPSTVSRMILTSHLGDIVVMHYLYKSTVDQFRDMIKLAKSKGRHFVRMDQCIGDPDAPDSWGYKAKDEN